MEDNLQITKWDKSKHHIYHDPAIEPFFNMICGTTEDNAVAAYLDFVEVPPSLPEHGEYAVLGLKLFTKTIPFEKYSAKVNGPKSVNDSTWIQMVSKMALDKSWELGEKHYRDLVENGHLPGGKWEIGNVEPGPSRIKYSFWKQPWKWFKQLFEKKIHYVWGPGQKQEAMRRKLISKILLAANSIAMSGRRGPANTIIVNGKMATILQDCPSCVVAPGGVEETTPGTIYKVGTIFGMTLYVDPYMTWNDTRVLVFHKGKEDYPGLFLAYKKGSFMSEPGKVTGELSIAELGFYPEKQFVAFEIDVPDDLI